MKKSVSIIGALLFSMNLNAQNVIDVYGEDDKGSELIIKKYATAVAEIQSTFVAEIFKNPEHVNETEIEKILFKRLALMEKIKKDGDYLYVNFDTVKYPGDKTNYTTIEVIKHQDPNRLRFVDSTAKQEKPIKHKPDLIDEMAGFSKIASTIAMEKKPSNKDVCPVYHCLSSFNHPKLKPYLNHFNSGVIKEKKLIVATLKNDPSTERRAAAIFLIGHLTDPHEIISVLTPYITDKDPTVRNNTMRVLATTLQKSHILDFDVMPLLVLLDSPEESDRNKSLWMLYSLVDSKTIALTVINNGGAKLIELLKLKQPNNHNIAYQILKKISGKDFGEYNIAGWSNWLNTHIKIE